MCKGVLGNIWEWRYVQTWELDGHPTEVIDGLHDGDEIVAQGTDGLRPGARVATKQIPAETQTRNDEEAKAYAASYFFNN